MAIHTHILERTGIDTFRLVLHVDVPEGTNATSIPWSVALVNSGRAHTSLSIGEGPGTLTPQEKSAIDSGRVLEGSFSFTLNPLWTPRERAAALDGEALKLAAEMLEEMKASLKWFGAVRISGR